MGIVEDHPRGPKVRVFKSKRRKQERRTHGFRADQTRVRITGIEFSADAPLVFRRGVLTLMGSGAFTRGTVTEGINPLDGSSLAGTPFDNITPVRVLASARAAAAWKSTAAWTTARCGT